MERDIKESHGELDVSYDVESFSLFRPHFLHQNVLVLKKLRAQDLS
jgi:hypothetical protein